MYLRFNCGEDSIRIKQLNRLDLLTMTCCAFHIRHIHALVLRNAKMDYYLVARIHKHRWPLFSFLSCLLSVTNTSSTILLNYVLIGSTLNSFTLLA